MRLDEIVFLFNIFEKVFRKGKKKKRIKKYNEPFRSMIYLRDICKDFQIVVENNEYDVDLTNPKLKGDLKNLANELNQSGDLKNVLRLCGIMRTSLNSSTARQPNTPVFPSSTFDAQNNFGAILNFISEFLYKDRNKGAHTYLHSYAIPVFGERVFKKMKSGYTLPKKRRGRTKNRKYSGRKQTNRVISRMMDLLLSAVKKYEEASKFYR